MVRSLLREMMAAAALSGLPVWGVLVVQEVRVVSPQHRDFSFDLPEIPQGQQVRLSMDARIDWKDLAGHNPYMVVNVNGTDLYGKDLVNKPVEFTEHDGADVPWVRGNLWRLYYAPDFSDAAKAPTFGYGVSSVDPFRFAWDITALVHAGANTLRITSTKVLPEPTTVVARQVTVDVGPPVAAPGLVGVSAAPQGPLPTYRARGRQTVPMDVQVSPGGAIRFGVAGRVLSVVSRSSEPAGQWVTAAAGNWQPVARGAAGTGSWTGTGYRVERVVRVADDHVKVRDTITNTGATRVGVIVEHRLGLPEKPDRLLLGGRPMLTRRSEPAHPTALAQWPDLLVGMVAEDDVFRVHVVMFAEPDAIGLADPRLGVPPGQSHTLEWSIYPIPKGDYWDFVNAVRRNWGSNWTIEGPVTFDHNSHVPKTAEQFREWIATRGARWISSGQTTYNQAEIAKYGGQHANNLGEGTAIPLAQEWCKNTADWIAKVRAVSPGAKTLIYLDSQICTEPEAETLYRDCRVFDANGARVATPYPYPIYLFLPTPDNPYGKALFKTLRYLCEDLGADGIYNDEFTYSAPYPFVYGLPWDGCSLDIDPGTHAIVRECSSDVLLQQPWKVEMVKYLRAKGKVLIGNGPLYTRSMLELKVPNFTEISSYSFLIETHLCTPMGLSTCDVEGTDRERVHSICRMLDHGAVIAPYVWTTQRPDFPYVQTLFPVTIEELREGVILGQERILTHRSGRFGWPDGKPGKVCVVDGDGQRVANPSVTEVREAGQWLAEIRMPSDHFAVIEKE